VDNRDQSEALDVRLRLSGDKEREMMSETPRFLRLSDVAEVLNISSSQVYSLVRRGDLDAIKIGGRGQWRVEASALEDYIQRLYTQTREFVASHPMTDDDTP
jgi:excisionase family DNA binding protein